MNAEIPTNYGPEIHDSMPDGSKPSRGSLPARVLNGGVRLTRIVACTVAAAGFLFLVGMAHDVQAQGNLQSPAGTEGAGVLCGAIVLSNLQTPTSIQNSALSGLDHKVYLPNVGKNVAVEPTSDPTPDPTMCAQKMTWAINELTGEVYEWPTTCLPSGWKALIDLRIPPCSN